MYDSRQCALQAVVAADVELMKLREEEAELNRRLAGASLEEPASGSTARKGTGEQGGYSEDRESTRPTLTPSND